MKNKLVFIACVSLLSPAFAEEYVVDQDHSRVAFEVSHLAFSKVTGWFRKYEGTIQFDEKKLNASSVTASVDAASIFTDNEKRDSHLKSSDFLDAEKFPKIEFKSASVKKLSAKKFEVRGPFSMHGVTKNVKFDMEYLGKIEAGGKHRIGFTGKTKINRKDFDVNFSVVTDSLPLVGDEVTIVLTLQGVLKSDLTPQLSQ